MDVVLHVTRPRPCLLGLHAVGWAFVGSSWNPDLYVRVCRRCGVELHGEHWDRVAPYSPGTRSERQRLARAGIVLFAGAASVALSIRASHRRRR